MTVPFPEPGDFSSFPLPSAEPGLENSRGNSERWRLFSGVTCFHPPLGGCRPGDRLGTALGSELTAGVRAGPCSHGGVTETTLRLAPLRCPWNAERRRGACLAAGASHCQSPRAPSRGSRWQTCSRTDIGRGAAARRALPHPRAPPAADAEPASTVPVLAGAVPASPPTLHGSPRPVSRLS